MSAGGVCWRCLLAVAAGGGCWRCLLAVAANCQPLTADRLPTVPADGCLLTVGTSVVPATAARAMLRFELRVMHVANFFLLLLGVYVITVTVMLTHEQIPGEALEPVRTPRVALLPSCTFPHYWPAASAGGAGTSADPLHPCISHTCWMSSGSWLPLPLRGGAGCWRPPPLLGGAGAIHPSSAHIAPPLRYTGWTPCLC